jgi:poly(A) polymerase
MRIARELIDPDAEKVVRRLARHGHKAYLVGGCVRDLLLGRTPKDFDVATSATPKEIKQLFRNCRIIGRRFRLAHIFFGGKIIETSTFRANPRQGEDGTSSELLIRRDNVFGTATEDARRRDFRINGLFYDVEAEEVIDHVGGLADLAARVISTIGNPDIRFQEDPVRMMRAIKFAARLGFAIEPDTYAAIRRHRSEIRKCAAPRVLEELYRLLRGGAARRSMELLVESGVAEMLSETLALMYREPEAAHVEDEAAWAATWADQAADLGGETNGDPAADRGRASREAKVVPLRAEPLALSWLEPAEIAERRATAWRLLDALDTQVARGEVSSSLVLASLCGPLVMPDLTDESLRPSEANERVIEVLIPLLEELRIARRDGERARQILIAQRRLVPGKRRRGKPLALVRRDYFRDTLALYEMWAELVGRDHSEIDYWRELAQGAGGDDGERPRKRRRRRGGRRRRRTPADDEPAESERDAGNL